MFATEQRQKMGGNGRSVAMQSLMTSLSSKFSRQRMVIWHRMMFWRKLPTLVVEHDSILYSYEGHWGLKETSCQEFWADDIIDRRNEKCNPNSVIGCTKSVTDKLLYVNFFLVSWTMLWHLLDLLFRLMQLTYVASTWEQHCIASSVIRKQWCVYNWTMDILWK